MTNTLAYYGKKNMIQALGVNGFKRMSLKMFIKLNLELMS